jgi:hypothetical protein
MDKKKIIMIGGGVVLLIAIIFIISLIGQKGQTPSQSTGVVTSIVLAKSEDKSKNPINATDIFSINDPEIHAIVTFNNLPINQNITYQWFDIKNNIVLKEEKRQNTAIFSGLSSSILIRDDKINWVTGDYEMRILINDQLIMKKPYSVQTDVDIEQGQVRSSIKSIVLTSAVDLQGKPTKNVSNVFSKDDENIFASVSYSGMPVKSDFVGKWVYVDTARLIKTYQKTIIGSDTFAFSMNAKQDSWIPIKKWPVGKYELRIYLGGDQIRTIPFTVQ